MPQISERARIMPESPIRKLVPFAEKAQCEGKYIYKLNIGQPDLPSPNLALDAMKNLHIATIAYSHSAGFLSLRKKLCAYYRKLGIPVNTDQLLITTGASEALIFTIGSIADPNDEIIVHEPFYANYYSFSTQLNVKVVPLISSIETNFSLPAIQEFEKRITARTKAILICNPGNPTGYLYSKEEIQQLADLARRYDLFLIADEVYRDYIYDGSQLYSILQESSLASHAIVIDSVSKRYSMCGARIGCLITKNQLIIDASLKFAQARLSPPTLAQLASEAALDVPDSYYKNSVAEYKARRDTLLQALRQIPDIQIAIPRGAFYCMVGLPVRDAEHFAIWLLQGFDIDKETVMLAPASGFYSSRNQGKNQIRIAFVLEIKALTKAVHILQSGLKAYLEAYPNKAKTTVR